MSAAVALLNALLAVSAEPPPLCAPPGSLPSRQLALQQGLLQQHAVHEAADVLESVLLADEAPAEGPATEDLPPLLLPHERVRLEAESLLLLHRQLELTHQVQAHAQALGLAVLPPPPGEAPFRARWTPPLPLEPARVRARAGAEGGARADSLLQSLQRTEEQLAHLEVQVVPATEEALGATLVALARREARGLEVLETLQLHLRAREALLARQVEREGLLEELAALLGCTRATLPSCLQPQPPPARPRTPRAPTPAPTPQAEPLL